MSLVCQQDIPGSSNGFKIWPEELTFVRGGIRHRAQDINLGKAFYPLQDGPPALFSANESMIMGEHRSGFQIGQFRISSKMIAVEMLSTIVSLRK